MLAEEVKAGVVFETEVGLIEQDDFAASETLGLMLEERKWATALSADDRHNCEVIMDIIHSDWQPSVKDCI